MVQSRQILELLRKALLILSRAKDDKRVWCVGYSREIWNIAKCPLPNVSPLAVQSSHVTPALKEGTTDAILSRNSESTLRVP